MNTIPFVKVHGAGNDFVLIDSSHANLPRTMSFFARTVCDRHTGVGADGLVLLERVTDGSVDVEMRIWNSDGSTAGMCGNAARCVAFRLYHEADLMQSRIRIGEQVVHATVSQAGDSSAMVTLLLDPPCFTPEKIPVLAELDESGCILLDDLQVGGIASPKVACLSVGNPHAVLFLNSLNSLTDEVISRWGPILEHHPVFPQRINVGFASKISDTDLLLRIWERGCGETLACGSGACAAVVAATRTGMFEPHAMTTVHLPGGTLKIRWLEDSIEMTGPAAVAFCGELQF